MNILPDEAQSHDDLNMPVEDMANLLHECDASKRHLEEQIGFYQVIIIDAVFRSLTVRVKNSTSH